MRPSRQIQEKRQAEKDRNVARAKELQKGGPIRYFFPSGGLEACVHRDSVRMTARDGERVIRRDRSSVTRQHTEYDPFDHERETGPHQHARPPRSEVMPLLLSKVAQSLEPASVMLISPSSTTQNSFVEYVRLLAVAPFEYGGKSILGLPDEVFNFA